MIKEFALRWPLLRQIFEGGDGTGPEAMSRRTRNLRPKNEGAQVARSVCPYCAVGCGQLVFHKDGKMISIEGDPESPVSRGRLCPKGADSFELLTHSKRLTKMKYRRPFSKVWEDLDLDKAMEMIADRIWESRERTFVEIERRPKPDANHGHRSSRRRDSRQRRKLPHQKALHRRSRHGLHQQSGPHMT